MKDPEVGRVHRFFAASSLRLRDDGVDRFQQGLFSERFVKEYGAFLKGTMGPRSSGL
jgi:hypothetical protein